MKTSDFYYDLPPELIAQTPIERRDASRLMTLDRTTGETGHHHFYDLPDFLRPGDCLILNDSRVLPARLLGHRLPGGGACEVLLLTDKGEDTWECLVRPGRKMRPGAKLSFGDGQLTALQFLQILRRSGKTASELASICPSYPQTLVNVELANQPGLKEAIMGSQALAEAVRREEEALGGDGRVLVRPSGTEPLIRVMVEAKTARQADDCAGRLADLVKTLKF